ncbi:S-4TM family putative pore-forming effector [Streptomyces sp. NBC_01474]|uniref:S-4TM family putative pore-forming effector n=1 Tax=Streptomyces sp. NBC_01474 TaxID=2903880 RepID=UPI002DD9FA1C|nr:S-4TM family putative pore-forming effector [Streptomyces sp. NBC_01474]WSD96710.1 S-4TM family putative pore-forming effector [Streptomyces sp. NBC_01474]
MAEPTSPRIWDAQNTTDRRRMVAAFARLYTDAKIVFAFRVAAVFGLAIAGAVVALTKPGLRTMIGGGGGVLLLILSFVIGSIEKWYRTRASATQEKFDTDIFQLPWNNLHADHPPQHVISRAAARYKGIRDKDWYADTGMTHRPFDVLICQASSFGWGATMHLIWAWMLVGAAVVMAGTVFIVGQLVDLSAGDIFVSLVIPSLAPFKEVGEQIKANFEAAKTKESIERKVNDIWAKGMSDSRIAAEGELRSVQDKILLLRQSNPYIPDWLDNAFHKKNEAAMRSSVADKVAQAERQGHAG